MNHIKKTKAQLIGELADAESRICKMEKLHKEKQASEDALRKSEERYRNYLHNIADVCLEFDLNGRCTFCNETVIRLQGFTPEEFMKLRFRQRHPSEAETDRVAAIIKKIYDTGMPSDTYESEFLCKDGSTITMEMVVSPIAGPQGEIVGFRGVGREITKRKKEQAELERYRDFMENIADGCFESDLAGNITYTSDIGAKRLGLTRDEFLGMNNRQYSKPAEAKRINNIFGDIYRTGNPVFIDACELIHKNGQSVFIEMSASLIRDAGGNTVGFRGTTRDITEKKKIQDALKASEAKYRFLTEKINDIVWTVDADLCISYISPSIKAALDYAQEEVLGRTAGDLMTAKSLNDTLGILGNELSRKRQEPIQPDKSVSFETAFYHKNGSVVWFDNVASSIRDEHEKIVGFHGVSRDVTERKQATAEKENLIEELKQALAEVKTLSGMLPVCAHCKKIRDDQGYWNQMESYITKHSDALFSHCVCPDCAVKLYPEYLPKKK
jgi:PAS domain S-box-containing protein